MYTCIGIPLYTCGVRSNLEYVGEIPEVEDVVEFDGRGQERGRHLLVQCQSCVHQLLHVLLHLTGEPSTTDVALENAQVDGTQGVHLVNKNECMLL